MRRPNKVGPPKYLSRRIRAVAKGILRWDCKGTVARVPAPRGRFIKFTPRLISGTRLKVLELKKEVDGIEICDTCGSFGLKSEFYRPHYCVFRCFATAINIEKSGGFKHGFKVAPIKLFKNPALPNSNPFSPGMLLEAIDPENQSLFCVVSVARVQGSRLELHFQGYDDDFNFWVNADSLDIFPPGWCHENNYPLQPPLLPPTNPPVPFNWPQYLISTRCNPAPRQIFNITQEDLTISTGVEVGMKLEAVDVRNPNNPVICVATVTMILGERFLIHFDSWDCIYDYFCDVTSPFIHPVGYCESNSIKISPPNDSKPLKFSWEDYLQKTQSIPMPSHLFQPLPPVGFKKGMRIEAVDLKSPSKIRPAVITHVEGHLLHVHYEGLPESYDAKFTELSPDIHPVGYCEHTHHPLDTSSSYDFPKEKRERVVILNEGTKKIVTRPEGPQFFRPSRHTPTASPRPPPPTPSAPSTLHHQMSTLALRIMSEKRKQPKKDSYIFERLLSPLKLENVRNWDCNQVFEFVKAIPGCAAIATTFREQEIDGDAFLLINKEDVDLPFGPSIKVIYAIKVLRGL